MHIGIDVGGTYCRVAAFRRLGDIFELDSVQFKVSGDFKKDFRRLVAACTNLIRHHGPVEGVGISLAGVINASRMTLDVSNNLPHWVGHPVAVMLAKELSCPVVLGNDAESGALAEAGHAGRDFWFVTWGSGIGGCLVRFVDGRVVSRHSELGHLPVGPALNELNCVCGHNGCLESYAGGLSLKRRYGKSPKKLSATEWHHAAHWMAAGLYATLMVQPVSLVIFGGGIGSNRRLAVESVGAELTKLCRVISPPEIRLSGFWVTASTVGAQRLLLHPLQ